MYDFNYDTRKNIIFPGGYNNRDKKLGFLDPYLLVFAKKNRSNKISEIPEPFGLRNRGNTCFLNSFLQILFNMDSFVKEINNIIKPLNVIPGGNNNNMLLPIKYNKIKI